ncbi:hypothetical protein [Cyanobium sp. Maggiore-St4-Cus]|uniref:hypothetical protein n=1 Tax=Cyanobium sp. Maggiore-St4-Cus TaxID=2823717 RepID=UPI0020CBB53D|nr:hypothetical protein [Cyanobium sp. Maggiore-St4-Cus]
MNLLPIHSRQDLDADFRYPNGAGMMLSSFLMFGPSYEGKDLKWGSRLEEVVWATFSCDLQRLNLVSTAIRKAVATGDVCLENNMDEVEQKAPEGKVLTWVHMICERSKSLAAAKRK